MSSSQIPVRLRNERRSRKTLKIYRLRNRSFLAKYQTCVRLTNKNMETDAKTNTRTKKSLSTKDNKRKQALRNQETEGSVC